MSPQLHTFLTLDLPALLTATLAVVTCSLLGNFLVLRRMSLMGDAVSHAVLPGLVAGFIVTGSRDTAPMLIGAAVAGVATVALVELVRRLGRLEAGAAMGVVFSTLFALGLVLIRKANADGVDLDVDCVLNGQLEDVFWLIPDDWASFWTWGTFLGNATGGGLPRELMTLLIVTLVTAGFVLLFFKELRMASFDPALSTSLGFHAGLINGMLMLFVAGAVVASFEAVGSILVVAMLICPAATARLLTDRLVSQVWVSLAVAVAAGVGGYVLGAHGPIWLGSENSLSASGSITVVAGGFLVGAIFASPSHGVVARVVRRLRLSIGVAREDLLAMLYRVEEMRAAGAGMSREHARRALGGGLVANAAVRAAHRRGEITAARGELVLSTSGRSSARSLVRTHRLWETYLVRELGLRPDHVHRPAMDLEHVTDERMLARLAPAAGVPAVDPHDRPIPPA